jgi:hypothetical protein
MEIEINGADWVLTLKEKMEEKEGSLYFIFNMCVIEIFLLKIKLLFCYFFFSIPFSGIPLGDEALSY